MPSRRDSRLVTSSPSCSSQKIMRASVLPLLSGWFVGPSIVLQSVQSQAHNRGRVNLSHF